MTLPVSFRRTFGSFILPKIISAYDLTSQPSPPRDDFLGVNIAFTGDGLLFTGGLSDWELKDESFMMGQFRDSQSLGDPGTSRGRWIPDWDEDFLYLSDGIFIITALKENIADSFVKDLEAKFSASIEKRVLVKCQRRPGSEAQSNHFGYRAGMSNPQINGATFGTTMQPNIQYPGSPIIRMGEIVMGYDGDEDKRSRSDWAKDGSFMVTRHLHTLVPEFDFFLLEHGPKAFPQESVKDAADHLGARLFGRWKDGTQLQISCSV
ncbi:hypothetical protein H0H87_004855 [Tephrocybe sp. NHM501043]|nr:hypothetical protein H0H87_004855 [Tephrocybe sp. NHM501043]